MNADDINEEKKKKWKKLMKKNPTFVHENLQRNSH